MILTFFFHQTLNRYFSYIRNKEKKIRKIWPLKVYSNLKQSKFYQVSWCINWWKFNMEQPYQRYNQKKSLLVLDLLNE